MTNREHERLQGHINLISMYRDRANEAFERLQELNATEGTGSRWCSAKTNALDLLKCGKDYMHIYDRYVEAKAREEQLIDLGSVLAELNFWKK